MCLLSAPISHIRCAQLVLLLLLLLTCTRKEEEEEEDDTSKSKCPGHKSTAIQLADPEVLHTSASFV